jgi:selT/selW/selH-like putative selenoprotein
VKQEIQQAFPGTEVEGNKRGSPRTGAFEVTDSNGTLYFSKLATGNFPNPGEVVQLMKAKGFK